MNFSSFFEFYKLNLPAKLFITTSFTIYKPTLVPFDFIVKEELKAFLKLSSLSYSFLHL